MDRTFVSAGVAERITGISRRTLSHYAKNRMLPLGAVDMTPGGHYRFDCELIIRHTQKKYLEHTIHAGDRLTPNSRRRRKAK